MNRRTHGRKGLAFLLAFVMVLGMLPGGLIAYAADASKYPTPSVYSAKVRVDESVGLRGMIEVKAGGSTLAKGIDPINVFTTRPNAEGNITSTSALEIHATAYDRYTLDEVTVVAIAEITHEDGTMDALKHIKTFTGAGSHSYTVPDFSGKVVKADTKVEVEVIVYADFTYTPVTTPAYTVELTSTGPAASIINGVTITDDKGTTVLSASNGSAASATSGNGMFSISGRTLIIDAGNNDWGGKANKTVKITGDSISGDKLANAYQVVVLNKDTTNTLDSRRVDLILDNLSILAGGGQTTGTIYPGLTMSNYDTYVIPGSWSTIGANYATQYNMPSTKAGNTTRRATTTTKNTSSPLALANVDAYITLDGTNVLAQNATILDAGRVNQSGLGVDGSASLIITDASTSETTDSTGKTVLTHESLYVRGAGCSSAIGTAGSNEPCGYVEIDGGYVRAESAHSTDAYAGIGNGGHYSATDPGIRGIVINGGKVAALGFHYGIGGNGGFNNTTAIDSNVGSTYIVMTGGDVRAETASGSGGAAIGFAYRNRDHSIRIGRPDRTTGELYDAKVTSVNWGYGAAISAEMTFYSGVTEAYSGEYAAAIGGCAVSNAQIRSTAPAEAMQGGSAVEGTPLTVYGGTITAESGAFPQDTYGGYPLRPPQQDIGTQGVDLIRGTNKNLVNTETAVRSFLNSSSRRGSVNSYGAAIGGAMGQEGGTANKIFAGTIKATASTYGAGIGGGGGGAFSAVEVSAGNTTGTSVSGAYAHNGGSGGNTWIGTLTTLHEDTYVVTGQIAPKIDKIESGKYGAGFGGGGSNGTGAGGDGGDVKITGGEITIKPGSGVTTSYGAGFGGGGSLNGNGGNGGDVTIVDVSKIDITMPADSYGAGFGGGGSLNGNGGNGGDVNIGDSTGALNVEPKFTITSGQYGAGFGGGGSLNGNGGESGEVKFYHGDFTVKSGEFGAGFGGGGSNGGNGGNAGNNVLVAPGVKFLIESGAIGSQPSYGAGIGGGGSNSGTGGNGFGAFEAKGGIYKVYSNGYGAAIGGGGSNTGTAGLGATSSFAGGTVEVDVKYGSGASKAPGVGGGVSVTGTSQVNTGKVTITGGNIYTEVATSTGGAFTLPDPTGTTSGTATKTMKAVAVKIDAADALDASNNPMQISDVAFSYQGSPKTGQYKVIDMYPTKKIGTTNEWEVWVWVPSDYKVEYDLNGGTYAPSINPGEGVHAAYGEISILLPGSTAGIPDSGETVTLVTWDEKLASKPGIDWGGLVGKDYYAVATHPQIPDPQDPSKMVDVAFIGWSLNPISTIYEAGDYSYMAHQVDKVLVSKNNRTVYAMWGIDRDGDGIADVLSRSGKTLKFDGNQPSTTTVSNIPATEVHAAGSTPSVPNKKPTAPNYIFLGWTEEDLSAPGSGYGVISKDDNFDQAIGLIGTSNIFYPYGSASDYTIHYGGNEHTVSTAKTIPMGTTDKTVYALWAEDADGDGVPDALQYHVIKHELDPATTPAGWSTTPTNVSDVAFRDGDLLVSTVTPTGYTATDGASVQYVFMGWTQDENANRLLDHTNTTANEPGDLKDPYVFAKAGALTGYGDITLYAVWAADSDGDGIPDYKSNGMSFIFDKNTTDGVTGVPTDPTVYAHGANPNASLINPLLDPATAGMTPYMQRNGWAFLGWVDESSTILSSGNGDLIATPVGATVTGTTITHADFITDIDLANTGGQYTFVAGNDVRIKAVWAQDANNNGIPDWLETKGLKIQYIQMGGGSTGVNPDSSTMPHTGTSNRDDGSGTAAGYYTTSDQIAVPADGARPYTTDGKYVFLGWSPYSGSKTVYDAGNLDAFFDELMLLYDIPKGTNVSGYNDTSGGVSPTPMAPLQYTLRPDATIEGIYDQLVAAAGGPAYTKADGYNDFKTYIYSNPTVITDLVTEITGPYFTYVGGQPVPSVGTLTGMEYRLHTVWAEDANGNGIPDMFEPNYTLEYVLDATPSGTTSVIATAGGPAPGAKRVLANSTAALAYGPTDRPTASFTDGNTNGLVFIGWSHIAPAAPYYYDTAATVAALAATPIIQNLFITGDTEVYAIWAEDSDRDGIPDVLSSLSLTYDGNGAVAGTVPTDSATYRGGDEATVKNMPVPQNSASSNNLFMYWTTEKKATGRVYAAGDIGILPTSVGSKVTFTNGNITLYAVWGEDTTGSGTPDVLETPLSVIYDANGGTGAPANDTGLPGTNVTLAPAGSMTRSGHVFEGWSLTPNRPVIDRNGTAPTDKINNVDLLTSDITVYAIWAEDANNNGTADYTEPKYTLTYDANGGTVGSVPTDPINYLSGEAATVSGPGSLSHATLQFDGWTTNASGTGTRYYAGDNIPFTSSNITLYAQWSANPTPTPSPGVTPTPTPSPGVTPTPTPSVTPGPSGPSGSVTPKTYTVTYDANGGTGSHKATGIKSGASHTVLAVDKAKISRDGYTFTGWNTKKDGTGTAYAVSDTIKVKENITLYAQWKKTEDTDDKNTRPNNKGVTGLNREDHMAYIRGYDDGTVRADASMTRAEAAQMFYNLLTDKKAGSKSVSFSDVEDGAWYATAIQVLSSRELINGYEDGSFAPNKTITRAEFASIMSRFGNLESGDMQFSDVAKGHWAYRYISNAASRGWVEGYKDGTFRPEAEITRAEVITLTNRVLDRVADKKFVDGSKEITQFSDLTKGHWAYYDIQEATNAHDFTWDEANYKETWTKLKK